MGGQDDDNENQKPNNTNKQLNNCIRYLWIALDSILSLTSTSTTTTTTTATTTTTTTTTVIPFVSFF
jgi:hypothetical protein